jgi:hypothetical protein
MDFEVARRSLTLTQLTQTDRQWMETQAREAGFDLAGVAAVAETGSDVAADQ